MRINIHRPTVVLDEVSFVRFTISLVYFLDVSVPLLRVVHCLSDQIDDIFTTANVQCVAGRVEASGIERRVAMLDCIY